MPVYDYKCTNCNTTFDIFHKGKEIIENIICPICKSNLYKKLISVTNIGSANSNKICEDGTCGIPNIRGGCPGGMCGLN